MHIEDEQLHVRVAWLYHMEDLTQAEIAGRLGLTRLRVNRILSECREAGLIHVAITSRLESCVALERQLCAEFGLADAVIVPTPRNADKLAPLVGGAAAEYLAHSLSQQPVRVFGVGWATRSARPSAASRRWTCRRSGSPR